VSPELLDILEAARGYNALTAGIFEPAVLPALEAAGYDRSFEQVVPYLDSLNSGLIAPESPAGTSIADLAIVDRDRCIVEKPAELRVDLGGIGKGWAVDLAAAALQPAGDFLIDAGGDIFGAGRAPGGTAWRIGIASPFEPDSDLGAVEVRNEAIATS